MASFGLSATILVLGPMLLSGPDRAQPEPRTRDLVALVWEIIEAILKQPTAGAARRPGVVGPGGLTVEGPDENHFTHIVPGILEKIERADFVIVDVSNSSANVAYEAGLVHALGLPHVFLTSDPRPYFYFRGDACIMQFDPSPPYDPSRPTHKALHDRIKAFYESWAGIGPAVTLDQMAVNQVSEFYKGLPIVDISAPAGIAAGYWRNSVRRFVRQDGYFDLPRRISWRKQTWPPKAPAEFTLPEGSGEDKVDRFLAIRPPNDLAVSDQDDNATLQKALANLGLRQCYATIHVGDPEDLRDYGALVLGRQAADGSVALIRPLVVIELPTTLWALEFSPRIKRILDPRPMRRSKEELKAAVLRRYREMIDRFDTLMTYFVFDEPRDADISDRYQFIKLAELEPTLRQLGYIR